MKHLSIYLLLFFLIITPLTAQEAENEVEEFSLSRAIEFAIDNNLNAENSRLDVSSAEKRIWETAASGLPQVSGSANYNNNLSLATTLIPDFLNDPSQKIEVQFGTKHFATAGISASQLVFSGQYFIGLQTARLFKEFTVKNLKLSEQQVKESVIQGYHLVLLAQNTLEALQGNLSNMEEIFAETNEMYKAGFLEENDVDQLDITLTDLENAVLAMKRQLVAARNLLKYQMGIDLDQEIRLTDSLSDLFSNLNFQSLAGMDLNVENNLNYQLLKDRQNLALMDMKAKRAEFLPTLSAFFSLDYTAQRDEFNLFGTEEDWYEASAIGLSLSLPIFSSGMRNAGLAQKKIAYEKAINTKRYAEQGLKVEYMQAQYDLANAYEQYIRQQKTLDLTKKVVSNTKIKYEEGLSSSLELTQVNDQYLQTLSNYTSSMVELLNAKLRIDVLMDNL